MQFLISLEQTILPQEKAKIWDTRILDFSCTLQQTGGIHYITLAKWQVKFEEFIVLG